MKKSILILAFLVFFAACKTVQKVIPVKTPWLQLWVTPAVIKHGDSLFIQVIVHNIEKFRVQIDCIGQWYNYYGSTQEPGYAIEITKFPGPGEYTIILWIYDGNENLAFKESRIVTII